MTFPPPGSHACFDIKSSKELKKVVFTILKSVLYYYTLFSVIYIYPYNYLNKKLNIRSSPLGPRVWVFNNFPWVDSMATVDLENDIVSEGLNFCKISFYNWHFFESLVISNIIRKVRYHEQNVIVSLNSATENSG